MNIDTETEREAPINADIVFAEGRNEDSKFPGLKTVALHCVKVATVVALLVVIIILAVYWSNGHSLLTEFSFQEKNVKTPVFICIEVFLAIIVLISLADILKGAIAWIRSTRKYTSLIEKDVCIETGVWKGIKLLTSKFSMRESLDIMQFQALAETGLLTKLAYRKATESALSDGDRPEVIREDEGCMSLSSGIAFQGREALVAPLSVTVTTVITGVKNAGKTSIFNRIMYGGFSEVKSDVVGLNFGLKTLKIDGPNMFSERKVLNIEVQIFDSCTKQEDVCEQLSFAFGNNVVLVIVCDANDPSCVDGVAPLLSQLKVKGMQFHASVFVNKVDDEDVLAAELRATQYHTLGGIDVYEVSAKTGVGIAQSFIKVISKAIGIEARNTAQEKQR